MSDDEHGHIIDEVKVSELNYVRDNAKISMHEAMTLMALSHGPLSMSELGFEIRLSRAAVTTLVDRLERKKLLERTNHPTDRRRIELVLTENAFRITMEAFRGPVEDL